MAVADAAAVGCPSCYDCHMQVSSHCGDQLPSSCAVISQVVFEEFGFNSFFTAPAPWFSLRHACGPQHPPSQHDTAAAAIAATSGIVVDAGFSACNVVPFFDGKLLAGGVRRLNLGKDHDGQCVLSQYAQKYWAEVNPCLSW